MRARLASFVIPFFAVLAVAGTPVLPVAAAAAAVERAPALGGEAERTPVVASHGSHAQLRAARESSARPSFWKLPPHALTLRLVATPMPVGAGARCRTGARAGCAAVRAANVPRPAREP